MNTTPLGLGLLGLSLLISTVASAQQPPYYPPQGVAPPAAGQGPGAMGPVRERVRAIVLDRINRELALDAGTAARVASIYDAYAAREQPVRQQLRQSRRRVVASVRGNAPVDDGTLNRLVDGLIAGKAQLQALEAERAQAIRQVLSPSQFARLVLTLPIIRAEVRREVVRAVRGRGGLGGRRGQGVGGPGGAAGPGGVAPASANEPLDNEDELE